MGAAVSCPNKTGSDASKGSSNHNDFTNFPPETQDSPKSILKTPIEINPMKESTQVQEGERLSAQGTKSKSVPVKRKSVVKDQKILRKLSTHKRATLEPVDMRQEDFVETKRRLSTQWRQSCRYNVSRNGNFDLELSSNRPSLNKGNSGKPGNTENVAVSNAIPPGDETNSQNAVTKSSKHNALDKKPSLIRHISSKIVNPNRSLERSSTQVALSIADYYETENNSGYVEDHRKELSMRLKDLRLKMEIMEDDGNCLFRSCSHHLFGHQRHHAVVRETVVEHMRQHQDMYSIYFECSEEWQQYIHMMSQNRTWGDELVLRAVTDAYGTDVHVVQSTEDNWYLVYRPESKMKSNPKIFLTYLSPVHYNALVSVFWG